jgi:hypothetical protein
MVRGGHGLLQVSLGNIMSYPCSPCGQPPRKGKGAKGKRKGKERRGRHGSMARGLGGHGLLKVSLGNTMPYPSTPCGRPPLKRPHSRLEVGRLQGERPAAVSLPLWIPHDVRLKGGREGKGEKGKRKRKGGGEHMGVWQGVAMDYFKYR